MGKVLKTVGIVAAVFAVTVATGGIGTGFIGAATATAGSLGAAAGIGLSATLSAALAGAAVGAALAGVTALATKKPSLPGFDQSPASDRLIANINPNAFGLWVFGETPLGTDAQYQEQFGQDNKFGMQLFAGAAHEIDSFGDLYVNDELVTFSGTVAVGSWSGALSRYVKTGTDSQTAISVGGSAWPTTARFRGVAHYALVWDATHDKIKSGIPNRITQLCKGAKVYDPRYDTTVGGSGSQRASDQSTWAYSNGSGDAGANWALVVLYYLLGWRNNGKTVVGVGVDPSDIDYSSFIAAANVCDELVDSIPRYHVGGVIQIDGDHDGVLRQLEANIGGNISKGVDGVWRVWAPHDDLVSVGSINDDDLIAEGAESHDPGGDLRALYNTGRGRFVSPDLLYQADDVPEVIENQALLDDGVERLLELDFTLLQDHRRAQRVLRHHIRRSRYQRSWAVAVGPKGLLFNYYDVVNLNTLTTNYENQLVRVTGRRISGLGVVVLQLREEDPLVYDTSIPLGSLQAKNVPATFDPSTKFTVLGLAAQSISLSGGSGTSRDGIRVSFDDPGPLVDKTQIEFRKQGDANWSPAGVNFVDNNVAVIQPVQPGTSYEVRVSHVSVSGVAGNWAQVSITSGSTEVSRDTQNVGSSSAAEVVDGTGRALTAIVESGVSLLSTTGIDDGSGQSRALTFGYTEGNVRDGDVVVFTPAWPSSSLPRVSFEGGRTDAGGLSGNIFPRNMAVDLSPSGFTADLKLVEGAGSITTVTETSQTGDAFSREINKSNSQQSYDNSYRYQWDITITNGPLDTQTFLFPAGHAVVGIYTNSGSGFVQRATKVVNGTNFEQSTFHGNVSQVISVSNLTTHGGREFKIAIESSVYGAILNSFDEVRYDVAVAPQSVTATPPGSPDMKFQAFGGVS